MTGRRAVCAALAVVLLSACGIEEGVKTRRGRGDAPHPSSKTINGDPADFIIEMPDGWGNVATKCAFDGWRIFESTKANGASALFAVRDASCHPKGTGPS